MSRVSIVKCADYDPGRVEDAVRRSVELSGGFAGLGVKGRKVLLKVNLTRICPPGEHIATHPAVVLAAAKMLKEAGAQITIGDSIPSYPWVLARNLGAIAKKKLSGRGFEEIDRIIARFYECERAEDYLDIRLPGGEPMFLPGDVRTGAINEDLFARAGLAEVREKTGAGLAVFDNAKWLELPNPGGTFLKKVWTTRIPADADVIITMPKFKTHDLMLLTGAIKNSLGMVPGSHKERYHRSSQTVDRMGEMLVDIFQVVKPQFAIMDGITGMEGNGPLDGDLRNIGIIASSADPVALDAVCSSVINYDPMEIATTRVAAGRGLGTADLGKIEIAGTPLEEVRIPGFKRPDHTMSYFW